jgi:hypothetical protein
MSNPLAAKALMAIGAGRSSPLTDRAYGMWQRAVSDPRLTRLVAGAYFGVENMGEVPQLAGPGGKGLPLTAWPGWQAFPGVARALFDGKGLWQEQPLSSTGHGRLVVTLPVGVMEPVVQLQGGTWPPDDGPLAYRRGEQWDVARHQAPEGLAALPVPLRVTGWRFTCLDIIACDPLQPAIFARLTKGVDWLGEDLLADHRDVANEDMRPLRLNRYPLDWWRAGNGLAVASNAVCLLERRAWRDERVLARGWICDDELHAADVAERQKRARAALTAERIPRPGGLAYVAARPGLHAGSAQAGA